VTSVPIPASNVLAGFEFDVQSVDLDFFTLALRWASNDVEVTTVGLTVPVASLTATPTSGSAPLTVQFTDTSTQWPTAWQWDFNNDGTIDSTQQNPSWTYTVDGVYSVRLSVTNVMGGATVTQSNLVCVGSVMPNPMLQMMPIAPGSFQMGSLVGNPDEQPVRNVTLTNHFWIGKFEVSQAQYSAVMGSNPSAFAYAANSPLLPVERATRADAMAYCYTLNATEQANGRVPPGYQYRLPTEAEWEYCCRAGTSTEWSTGIMLTSTHAFFSVPWSPVPVWPPLPVGSLLPNAWGIHDMHGNVDEYCLDTPDSYSIASVVNPYSSSGSGAVIRGGTFYANAFGCRSAFRGSVVSNWAYFSTGFRVVLAPILVP
jgi:formylglycine-generating enzyme required for sulfatase activity